MKNIESVKLMEKIIILLFAVVTAINPGAGIIIALVISFPLMAWTPMSFMLYSWLGVAIGVCLGMLASIIHLL